MGKPVLVAITPYSMGIMEIMAAVPQSNLSTDSHFSGPAADLCQDFSPNLESATAEEVLTWAITTHGGSLAISTSFQREGMVILDMAARISPNVRVFTLDTGCLPEETHRMIETVRERY